MSQKLYKHCMICQRVEVGDKWIPVEEFRVLYPEAQATNGYCSQECLLKTLNQLKPELRDKILESNKEHTCQLSELKPS